MKIAGTGIPPPLPVEDLEHILAKTEGLWEELRGRSLFITGGTGFFGRWLLESFAFANQQLGLKARAHVLSRNPRSFAEKAPHLSERDDLILIDGDVRTFPFPNGTYSHVIHAGTTSSAPVEPREMFDTIVDGTRRVLDFASTHGTRKFLFVSSGAVYGRQPSDVSHIPEDFNGAPNPLDPASAYGEGKRAAELLCGMAGKSQAIDVTIARCFAFVGPHLPLDAHFAIGNFIRDAMHGGPVRIGGDGTPYRSYLYAADLAVWLWTILFRGAAGRAYNVGSSEAYTLRDVAHVTSRAVNPPCDVQIAKAAAVGIPPSRYVPATDRAKAELGLEPSIKLEEAIRKTIPWHQKHL